MTSGTFDDFICEDIYDLKANVYDTTSWHYSYVQKNCDNNNVEHGKFFYLMTLMRNIQNLFYRLLYIA